MYTIFSSYAKKIQTVFYATRSLREGAETFLQVIWIWRTDHWTNLAGILHESKEWINKPEVFLVILLDNVNTYTAMFYSILNFTYLIYFIQQSEFVI